MENLSSLSKTNCQKSNFPNLNVLNFNLYI